MRFNLTPLFLLEIVISALFIFSFGFANFLIFIIISMFFGALLLGLSWQSLLSFHISDFKDMLANFAFIMAGFLLLIPGVLSSIFGLFILLFTLFSKLIFKPKFSQNPREKSQDFKSSESQSEEIIDVEIIEDKK